MWVADCSVMPSLPSGNTNATAIMIGDKGADHVLQALRSGSVPGRRWMAQMGEKGSLHPNECPRSVGEKTA